MKVAFRTEEVKTEQLDITGSIFGVQLISGGQLSTSAVSGAFARVVSTGSLIGGRVQDTNGAILSSATGSPSTFGQSVQVGQSNALLATTGSVTFGRPFANVNYILTLTPTRSGTSPWGIVTKNTSGADIYGASGGVYDFVAIGAI